MLNTHMHASHTVVFLNQINKMVQTGFPYYSKYCDNHCFQCPVKGTYFVLFFVITTLKKNKKTFVLFVFVSE